MAHHLQGRAAEAVDAHQGGPRGQEIILGPASAGLRVGHQLVWQAERIGIQLRHQINREKVILARFQGGLLVTVLVVAADARGQARFLSVALIEHHDGVEPVGDIAPCRQIQVAHPVLPIGARVDKSETALFGQDTA